MVRDGRVAVWNFWGYGVVVVRRKVVELRRERDDGGVDGVGVEVVDVVVLRLVQWCMWVVVRMRREEVVGIGVREMVLVMLDSDVVASVGMWRQIGEGDETSFVMPHIQESPTGVIQSTASDVSEEEVEREVRGDDGFRASH